MLGTGSEEVPGSAVAADADSPPGELDVDGPAGPGTEERGAAVPAGGVLVAGVLVAGVLVAGVLVAGVAVVDGVPLEHPAAALTATRIATRAPPAPRNPRADPDLLTGAP
jgi:hypothetical protein